MKTIRVREPDRGELEQVARLIAAEVYDEIAFQDVKAWIESSGWPSNSCNWWFVLEKEGEIVGAICWTLYDRSGGDAIFSISWLAIKAEDQGKGLGEILWNVSREKVWDASEKARIRVRMVFVQTDEENEKACWFYRKVLGDPIEVKIPDVWGQGRGVIFFFKQFREKTGAAV